MAKLDYSASGVKYDVLDAFKRVCQKYGKETKGQLAQHNFSEATGSRGDSAYLIEGPDAYYAHVEEGLGTKNLVADKVEELTGKTFYKNIGIDTVAMITNDMIVCGALPVSMAMHAGVGDTKWFANEARAEALAQGFAEGCVTSGAVWGGGETPALKGVINDDTIVLAGSCFGMINPKENRILGDIQAGDKIVLLESSGVHSNGLSLCRKIAEELPEGYAEKMQSGRTFGESLLDATVIYVPFIKKCQEQKIPLHYAVHITGHGWRKLMRLEEPFVYKMTSLPPVPEIFTFMIEKGFIDQEEGYKTFNMGAGFAVYVRPEDAERCVAAAQECGIKAYVAGEVAKEGSRKAVEIVELSITFEEDSMNLRG